MEQTTRSIEPVLNELLQKSGANLNLISDGENTFEDLYKKLSNIKPVRAVQDDSSHWYVIPNDLAKDFYKDSENEDMCDSGEFGAKYDHYRTGGDLNITQLYAEV